MGELGICCNLNLFKLPEACYCTFETMVRYFVSVEKFSIIYLLSY